jgi:hypothetical protein
VGERLVYGIPSHERRGLKLADDTAGPEVDPTTQQRVPSAEGIARARTFVAKRFPALADAPIVEARVCQYEASTDGNYLVDRHPGSRTCGSWAAAPGTASRWDRRSASTPLAPSSVNLQSTHCSRTEGSSRGLPCPIDSPASMP